MKRLILLIMIFNLSSNINSQELIYDIKINDIKGFPIDLNQFRGKYILFVNVASNCGFTKQYSDLEELYQRYKKNLIIIGLPCNQFGAQEPGDEEQIEQFCVKNFDISFLLTEKVDVKGYNQHMLYSWLTNADINGKFSSSVRWNFQKYLVNPRGELMHYFYSTTKPMSDKITKRLKQ